ncbi:MAG TPA: hypothetical protein VKY27_02580 [Bacteriovoracaceae bacterium]|nr:hypothetical protein [Bacteriovoracaceae bacterium]
MKYCFFICFLLLLGCGSPLDEGYWKDYNREADLNPDEDGEEISFTIDFEPLHDFDFNFSDQSMTRDEDGTISVSINIEYPKIITLQSYQIESTPCSSISPLTFGLTTNDQTNTFNFSRPLNEMTDNPDLAIEGRFLYLYGSWPGQTTTRIACSEITL